ncbi:MAG TPA: peptidase M61 [Myxococcales bacterium]|jgi:predicted metalloprotease with PDZ domain|nr:peptidase M61 [Myxococcales bacterium]
MPAKVRYHVEASRLHEHLFDVQTWFPAGCPELRLWMPAWTPGSYLLREYARHVQDFAAFAPEGTPLSGHRLDKGSWQVSNPRGGEVSVRYRVYANELTVRTSHLDGSHGYFNGASIFMTTDAHRALPCELSLAAPEGWCAFCALPERDGSFHAADFDELVDSPVELGPHATIRFDAAGKPHEIVAVGAADLDRERLTGDLAAICETAAALFGGLPCERYLFIVHLTEKARGGLEHRASCTLHFPRFGLRPGKGYEDFLALAAHEYFHLWNVKRILPRAFVPFDYRKENYSRMLWAFEGITSYYDMLLTRRAGRCDARLYLQKMGETITSVESMPGRRAMSLEESSLLAWTKLYRPDENTPNSTISYYSKGEVVAMLLDLQLRAATEGRRSLDDAMRLLFERHGDGSGVPEDGVEAVCRELGGEGLAGFFEGAVRGTGELDYSVLASAGLVLKRRPKRGVGDKGGTPGDQTDVAWLGVELKPGDRALVATALADSPATELGLYAGDEIVALDGFRVSAATLLERLDGRNPGDRARLAVFRGDQLLELEVRLAARPHDACFFEKLASPTPQQRALFQAWLGEPFD